MMAKETIEMGWAASPVQEQFPELPKEIAEAFDTDNQQLTRLSVRGILTKGEADKARARYVKNISRAVNKSRQKGGIE
jgi:hypothetical protein